MLYRHACAWKHAQMRHDSPVTFLSLLLLWLWLEIPGIGKGFQQAMEVNC